MPDESEEPSTARRETEPNPADAADIPLEAVFRTLAHRRRRYVLYLLQRESPAQLRELGARIADWCPDRPDVARVCASLHHTHLPRLEDIGAVTYDPHAGAVSLAAVEPFEAYLEFTAEAERA